MGRCKHGIEMPEMCCAHCKPQPGLSAAPRPRVCHACGRPVEAAYLAPDGTRHKRLCSLQCFEAWQNEDNHQLHQESLSEANQKRSRAMLAYWTDERKAEAAKRGKQRDMTPVMAGNRRYWTDERRAERAKQMRAWHAVRRIA